MATNAVCATTPITTKLLYNGSIRRFKIPLKDCGANTLPGKLKELLSIPEGDEVIFERWSDSAASYVVLDSNKPAIYKQLYRAAKAKLKLRIKVTDVVPEVPLPHPSQPSAMASSDTLVQKPEATPAVVPMEKLTEAVAAYLDCEEGKTKLRTTIGEEVEKEIEKRSVLSQSFLSTTATTEKAPVVSDYQAYAVYCNVCSSNIGDVHYHCDICDGGDFDLCENCSLAGQHCFKPEHWMIKRSIVNGQVTSSYTQVCREASICAKPASVQPVAPEKPAQEEEISENDRTCNCCCEDGVEQNFVECTVCEDYDLCLSCHGKGHSRHGHDPSHEFRPANSDVNLTSHELALLAPGRNFRHFAICDGCDKQIYGVRHKCFTCPDWDLCSTCYKSVNEIHAGHRFAAIYSALGAPGNAFEQHHYGIYCDGPHCTTKGHYNWIRGVRYKCAICPDFDLCARCEASPHNKHNVTHPLIKFRTPIRSVTVQTVQDGQTSSPMGDPVPQPPVARNSSTSVQTVAEVKPVEEVAAPVEQKTDTETQAKEESQSEDKPEVKVEKDIYVNDRGVVLLSAHYVEDMIADGTVFKAGASFAQTWTLSNEGTIDWPIGTSLHFIGGDYMAATDMTSTSSPVKPGERASFSVNLTAPHFVDRNAIGYWGLVTPCGVRFGQQLWVEIEVERQIKEEPKEEMQAIPAFVPDVNAKTVASEVSKVEESTEQVKEESVEPTAKVEAQQSQDLLTASHSSDMIFPTLDKESTAASAEASVASLVEHTASAAPAPAAPSTTGSAPLHFDDVSDVVSDYSIGDDDLEVFISDDEDFEVLNASDDEDFSSSASSTA